MISDVIVTLSTPGPWGVSHIQLGYLEEHDSGTWACTSDYSWIFGGWAFCPTPKAAKNPACLLSKSLHGSGFNLSGNLLRC